MSNLRDEIAEIIQTTDEPWLAADDIMTAVREALLSDEAVEKAEDAFAGRNPGVTWGNMFNAFVPAEDRARDAITAALDAVTGEGGER